MEFAVENLNAIEAAYIAGTIIVFVILTFLCQKRIWIWFEIAVAGIYGLGFLIVPGILLKLQTKEEPDEIAKFVARPYGATLFVTGITWFLLRDTRDATATITLMMSRVVSSSLLLMIQLFSYYTSKSGSSSSSVWNANFMPLFLFPTGLWVLSNLIHLLRSHDFNTYPQHNTRQNNHLRVDAWLELLLGVSLLAFPQRMIGFMMSTESNISEVALHVVRAGGAINIGEAVTSLQAPGFLHSRDKLVIFTARLIAMLLSGILFYVWSEAAWYNGAIFVPMLLNAVIGRFTNGTTVYVVSTPTKPKEQLSKKADAGKKIGAGDGDSIEKKSD